jgi:hypothetical protein
VQNLIALAMLARESLQTATPRATDIRQYVRRELEAAYDIATSRDVPTGFETLVETIAAHVRERRWDALNDDYISLASTLPGDLQFVGADDNNTLVNTPTILIYSIAVEAGLLNEQLRQDIGRVAVEAKFECGDVASMVFHRRDPLPQEEEAFRAYVRARWPIITFALDPVTDEQNIADASSIRRDLQLALSFAFATGQLSFRQLNQFQRRLEIDAETIALNRTVTAFAHGNDTFGFRFTPRFQTPPQERSNIELLYNQLVKGGPGRDYQLKNSKLEPGLRDLSAVVIMPSFLRGVQMDAIGNFYPLQEPDEMKIPRVRMLEQGRTIMDLQHALGTTLDCRNFRPGDLRRLVTQVHELEEMLPMQTRTIRVPYENTLGGFQLFREGTTALVPMLSGFEGAESIEQGTSCDILVFGKHFSIQETQVIVGGRYLTSTDLDVTASLRAAKASTEAAHANSEAAKITSEASEKSDTEEATNAKSAAATASQKHAEATKANLDAAKKSLDAAATKLASASATKAAPAPEVDGRSGLAFDVVSREVLRLRVPGDVQPSRILGADGKPGLYVEIYVATPNGISNRLLVPYREKKAEASPRHPVTLGYAFVDESVTLSYKGVSSEGPFVFDPTESSDGFKIKLEEPAGILPELLDVAFKLKLPGDVAPAAAEVRIGIAAGEKGIYSVREGTLAHFANLLASPEVVKLLVKRGYSDGNFLSVSAKLTPIVRAPEFIAVPKGAGNELNVALRFVLSTHDSSHPRSQLTPAPPDSYRSPFTAPPAPAVDPPREHSTPPLPSPNVSPGTSQARPRKDAGISRSTYRPPVSSSNPAGRNRDRSRLPVPALTPVPNAPIGRATP